MSPVYGCFSLERFWREVKNLMIYNKEIKNEVGCNRICFRNNSWVSSAYSSVNKFNVSFKFSKNNKLFILE
jgi:hypothetical protein